jgi:hypothetical protein|tara:strand:- start:933 stop:1553 length:621 start_codon:yes stop_codon:yes gene_type:complete
MHRSGTSLLAKVLEKGGIFMGVFKDPNFEAIHFLSENQKTLQAAGGSWLDPLVPSKEHWTTFSSELLYYEHFQLNGRIQKWKNKRKNPDWGFKDPRNSFTLNMWLHKYPKAKVIFIKRDVESVTKSLQRRNKKEGEVYDERLESQNFCNDLWLKYTEQCQSYKSSLEDRMLILEYDDLIQLNTQSIKRLENFTGKSLKAHLKFILR